MFYRRRWGLGPLFILATVAAGCSVESADATASAGQASTEHNPAASEDARPAAEALVGRTLDLTGDIEIPAGVGEVKLSLSTVRTSGGAAYGGIWIRSERSDVARIITAPGHYTVSHAEVTDFEGSDAVGLTLHLDLQDGAPADFTITLLFSATRLKQPLLGDAKLLLATFTVLH